MELFVFEDFDYKNLIKISSSHDQFIKKQKLSAQETEISVNEIEKNSSLISNGPLLSIYTDNFPTTYNFSVDSYSFFSPDLKYKSYYDLIINLSMEVIKIEVMTRELCQIIPKQNFIVTELDTAFISPEHFHSSQERRVITLRHKQALMCQFSRYPFRVLEGGNVLRLKGYFCSKGELA